jgi:predicted ATPase
MRNCYSSCPLGQALIPLKGYAAPEVEQAYTRARELCERLGDPPQLFPALYGLSSMYFVRAQLRSAYELAERVLLLAQGTNDLAQLLYAHAALGRTSFHKGELLLAREHLEIAISLYDRESHRALAFQFAGVDAGVSCLSYAAQTMWHLGYPDKALERVKEALALASGLYHPVSLAFAEYWVGLLYQLRQEPDAALQAVEGAIAVCTEHGFTLWLALATCLRGAVMAKQGRSKEGIAQIHEGLVAVRATGADLGRPTQLTRMAEAFMGIGRFDEALAAVRETLAAADENEDRQCEPETHRLKGELLLKQDDSAFAEAQKCFDRAIEIARNQNAKSWELRATTSLARLLASQGPREAARTMLGDIYNWFTEGFDTADLIDAKALLDDLSG